MRVLGIALIFGLCVSIAQPAYACINDREVVVTEEEFKSEYKVDEAIPVAENNTAQEDEMNPAAIAILGIGALMLGMGLKRS